MPYTQEVIEVGTTATKIAPSAGANVNARAAFLRTDASEAVYLGGSDVTTTTGVRLDADTLYEFDLSNGAPYLVAGSAVNHNVAFGEGS